MNAKSGAHGQEHLDVVYLFALQALPPQEVAAAEAQIASCGDCRRDLDTLRRVVQSFVGWPTDILRPAESLWDRLTQRIGGENTAPQSEATVKPPVEPEWEETARGVRVKILAQNSESDRVGMLVRLDPGTAYPGHTHAGVEEVYLLDGVLNIDHKTFYPGDFFRSEPGSVDRRVWTETGCTCFLETSVKDLLF